MYMFRKLAHFFLTKPSKIKFNYKADTIMETDGRTGEPMD